MVSMTSDVAQSVGGLNVTTLSAMCEQTNDQLDYASKVQRLFFQIFFNQEETSELFISQNIQLNFSDNLTETEEKRQEEYIPENCKN